MFIGQVERQSNYARKQGSKDLKPRKKRMKQAGAIVGGGVATVAALKNRKKIGAGIKKAGQYGQAAAIAGEAKVRQMGRKGMNKARQVGSSAKGAAQGASSAVQGGVRDAKQRLGDAMNKMEQRGRDTMQKRKNKQAQQMKYRNMMRG